MGVTTSDMRVAPRSPTPELSPINEPANFVKSEIKNRDIVIFSKSYCQYCHDTKQKVRRIKENNPQMSIAVYELDKMGHEGREIQYTLLKTTGQKTVPNVFIAGQHIGGNDRFQKLSMSKIQSLLDPVNL